MRKAVMGSALFMCLSVFAQQPGDPSKTPVQLPVDQQNSILKLEVEDQDMQAVYNDCNSRVQGLNEKFQANSKKIEDLKAEGLKKLGLDPATHDVNIRTFYVSEKPVPAKPDAKK